MRSGSSTEPQYPAVLDPERVGSYPASSLAGGGYVWDAVLEYRVWCHPDEAEAEAEDDGSDYYNAFATCEEALACWRDRTGAEEPLALVLQREYIDEPEPGEFRHVREERVTEWPVEFLTEAPADRGDPDPVLRPRRAREPRGHHPRPRRVARVINCGEAPRRRTIHQRPTSSFRPPPPRRAQ